MIRWKCALPLALTVAMFAAHQPAAARNSAPSVSSNFPIGTSGAVCEAVGTTLGNARQSIFDRKWTLLCRDIASPVGTAFALRGGRVALDLAQRERGVTLVCDAPGSAEVTGAGMVTEQNCRDPQSGTDWVIYSIEAGRTLYAVEGYAGYDNALRLALASIVQDRIQPSEISVATLGTGESAMMIKAMADFSDIDTVIGQGYRGNNSGAYVKAAELFAAAPALLDLDGEDSTENLARLHDVTVNRALQLSNIGSFDQAAVLFREARAIVTRDPVQLRLGRNFEAIDAINRGDFGAAVASLDRPMPPIVAADGSADKAIAIDPVTAAELNASEGEPLAGVLGQESRLTPSERALIIDAQALQLRGTVMRLQGDHDGARPLLSRAYTDAMRVRDGKVVSITRLRAQVLSELALSYEQEGRAGEAERLLREGVLLVEQQYPDSASVNAMRAQLAGFLIRHQQREEAARIYREIVGTVSQDRTALVGMTNLMRPWFDVLSETAGSDTSAASELFAANQLVERPGAADSLDQLARQFEGGSGEAADQFRRSLNIARELERARVRLARANALAAQGTPPEGLEDLRAAMERLTAAQAEAMNSLSAYPQYRAISRRSVTTDELRATLKPGEAYLKLARLGDRLYASYISEDVARGWKLDKSASEIADAVAILRDSISMTMNGMQLTYPFEIDTSLELFDTLLGPVASELVQVDQLIFEPDGALLQLPITLLTGDKAGVAAYHDRIDAGGDEYDFTGIEWLGRRRSVSTALSATSFRSARGVPASMAVRAYLGLGHNKAVGALLPALGLRGGERDPIAAGCQWPAATWNRPIAATELIDASSTLRAGRPELMTGAAFSDSAVIGRSDLNDFRILHFATHGLVTAPRPGCPARPALVTSFGAQDSDGLLAFREIFDLKLDADLVILSACDTAGQATLEATLDAGVTTGGGQALDGLVRAFIAAGARDVVASHWPAPDEFDATQRLFSSLFAAPGVAIGEALRRSQVGLMDDPDTSHPFYWAGFAIVGDGARPLPGR